MLLNASSIRKARPPLIMASPLSFWLCMGYVGLNLALGYVIYSVPDVAHLAIYRLFSQHLIGGAFALNAVLLLGALVMNAWRGIRFMLGCGLFLKSMYAYSLIDLGIRFGFENINGVMAIWLFITWVQLCLIIFFAPPLLNGKGQSHAAAK